MSRRLVGKAKSTPDPSLSDEIVKEMVVRAQQRINSGDVYNLTEFTIINTQSNSSSSTKTDDSKRKKKRDLRCPVYY